MGCAAIYRTANRRKGLRCWGPFTQTAHRRRQTARTRYGVASQQSQGSGRGHPRRRPGSAGGSDRAVATASRLAARRTRPWASGERRTGAGEAASKRDGGGRDGSRPRGGAPPGSRPPGVGGDGRGGGGRGRSGHVPRRARRPVPRARRRLRPGRAGGDSAARPSRSPGFGPGRRAATVRMSGQGGQAPASWARGQTTKAARPRRGGNERMSHASRPGSPAGTVPRAAHTGGNSAPAPPNTARATVARAQHRRGAPRP